MVTYLEAGRPVQHPYSSSTKPHKECSLKDDGDGPLPGVKAVSSIGTNAPPYFWTDNKLDGPSTL